MSTQPATQPATQHATQTHLLHDALRQELLRLAQHEDDAASREAARVHYWEPTPVTVVVHRQCAAALRDAADELLAKDGPDHVAGAQA
ncbi:hypothetical protein [Nocardioides sp. zg-1230]|uniref:hypothetical protein n=1 Tax=Nocardioides sp. zg-1230 TaxID=2736601 RepID=UPI001556243A|nr:hypothetical protein [Nocardioides sp. zg-1230]NPC42957.1 hypothetical protein [Nocardioides sp. zg-1230]